MTYIREDKSTTHVYDWIEQATCSEDENERYAAFFLHHKTLSATFQTAFRPYVKEYKLFCTYGGKRYRVTGASRFGDVWLIADIEKDQGYSIRVNIDNCSQWSASF